MEIILLIIVVVIIINIVGFVVGLLGSVLSALGNGVSAIFQWIRRHLLITLWLVIIAPFIFQAALAIVSGAYVKETIIEYALIIASPTSFILFFWVLCQLIMRVRLSIWLNYTAFGEAARFPGGERSLKKQLKAGTVKRIEYIYVISVPFLAKYYNTYRALLDSSGAATPQQFAEICASNPGHLNNSEPLLKAVLSHMVSRGDAHEVKLDKEAVDTQGIGGPLFVSEHPAVNSIKKREISLD